MKDKINLTVKSKICFAILISLSFVLSSCGAWKPLLTEKEVLSKLSERYGEDFVILETINDCEFTFNSTIRCRLYKAAPAENQEQTFWVHSQLGKYWGGDSLPMSYSCGISDTYAFDYFLERFDALLTENGIEHFFRVNSEKVDMTEHLKNQHLQQGEFVILITQETAEDIVTKILEIREQIADEYPLSNYLEYFSYPNLMCIQLFITFCDEDYVIADGDLLSSFAYFMPYDKKHDEDDNIIYRDNKDSILADIYENIYGFCDQETEK